MNERQPAINRRRFVSGSMAGLGTVVATGIPEAIAMPPDPARPSMGTRLVLLGTAGGPPPVAGRYGISSALVVGDRTYLIDCGRGSVSQYMQAGLRFDQLASTFVTHLHVDHVCGCTDFLLLPTQNAQGSDDQLRDPVSLYGPGAAGALSPPYPPGRDVHTAYPESPTPGLAELVDNQLAGFAYSINALMRDAAFPDPRELVELHEIAVPDVGADPLGPTAPRMRPFPVMDDGVVRVSAILVPHGPVFPAFAYRFDTPDGSVVFSGDTARSDNLTELARGADVLVHEVVDLDLYARQGAPPAVIEHHKQSHTDVNEVGAVAEAAGVSTLVLSHYVPADPRQVSLISWQRRAQHGFSGRAVAGRDLQQIGLRRTDAGVQVSAEAVAG